MSKALRNFPKEQQLAVARRRAAGEIKSNGANAARDYLHKHAAGKLSAPVLSEGTS
ncbi:hypothetical protein QF038_001824 [Pseudarthrobacter sp. W1I19]|nr:hypothetical protein [Pseudarthrobacter sp. W1I19]